MLNMQNMIMEAITVARQSQIWHFFSNKHGQNASIDMAIIARKINGQKSIIKGDGI